MKREWKPGDVAMRRSPAGDTQIATRVARCQASSALADGPHWHFVSPNTPTPQCGRDGFATYRSVVVIDPEDREQVKALIKSLPFYAYEGTVDQMQAALRSLIDPPKPEEPTGLGAVVEDSDGLRWMRMPWDEAAHTPWASADKSVARFDRAWSGITAVKVLSEGVQS